MIYQAWERLQWLWQYFICCLVAYVDVVWLCTDGCCYLAKEDAQEKRKYVSRTLLFTTSVNNMFVSSDAVLELLGELRADWEPVTRRSQTTPNPKLLACLRCKICVTPAYYLKKCFNSVVNFSIDFIYLKHNRTKLCTSIKKILHFHSLFIGI